MPLNMNQASSKPSAQRQLIPAGQHMARIVQVIDLGLQNQRPYQGQEKPPKYEMYITFEFPDERIEVNGESRPMWKSRTIGLSSDDRSVCYKWYKQLDPAGKHKGDWSKLIDTPCAALIVHDAGKGQNEGKTFDKVAEVMPLMKGMSVPPLENDPVVFDLTSPNVDVFNEFPDWLKNKIKENLEFDGSKLQNLLEGNPIKWTARAEGDAPSDIDSTDVSAGDTLAGDVDGEDDPW